MEMCRAGLQADCAAMFDGPAPGRSSSTAAAAATDATAAAAAVAPGSRSPAGTCGTRNSSRTAGSSGSDSVVGGVSQWAPALSDTLQTLSQLWSGAGGAHASEAAAQGVLSAAMQLFGHEVAVREPLPLPGTAAARAESEARLHSAVDTCLGLRGPAAAAAQQSLLQQLGSALSAACCRVARAFLVRMPGGAASLARAEALAGDPAGPPAAAASMLFSAAPPPPREVSAADSAQTQPPPAAADLDPATAVDMTALANVAYCVARVTAVCTSSQGPQRLLAPGFESGHEWAMAIAATLGTAARWFELDVGGIPHDVLITAYVVTSCLAGAAVALLQRRVAAGLEALQQAAGVQLVDALAAHVACESQPLFVAAALVRSTGVQGSVIDDCVNSQGCIVGGLVVMRFAQCAEAVLVS